MGVRRRTQARKVSRHVVKKKTRPGKNAPHPALECIWESRETLVNNFTNAGLCVNPNVAVPLKPPKKIKTQVEAAAEKPKTQTIELLEDIVERAAERLVHVPEGEAHHIRDLIQKYDADYAKMARDIKLNVYQHTAAVLKRKCQNYLKEFPHPRQ